MGIGVTEGWTLDELYSLMRSMAQKRWGGDGRLWLLGRERQYAVGWGWTLCDGCGRWAAAGQDAEGVPSTAEGSTQLTPRCGVSGAGAEDMGVTFIRDQSAVRVALSRWLKT